MDKTNFAQHFAQRLREALVAAGFHAHRSTSGIDIHKLTEITGYSSQICRKYLKGEAIPEPAKLTEIAKHLNVSAGWLLFGDTDHGFLSDKIFITKPQLQYVLTKAHALYNHHPSAHNFLLDLITKLSQLDASDDQAMKVIDLAFSSIEHALT